MTFISAAGICVYVCVWEVGRVNAEDTLGEIGIALKGHITKIS